MRFLRRAYKQYLLNRYKKQGLQIAEDCRLMGMPDFGTEPYLISIAEHVTISGKVTFLTHDGATFLFRDRPEYKDVVKFGRITIHRNCFIGHGSTILPNVAIGPNSIVAAGAVVTKDVPPDTVVGGVPAKPLMSTQEYTDKVASNTPDYDVDAYKRDRRSELLRVFPYPW